ncbi:MAG: hypothetical protein E7082_02085 [Bacteroidales bacterium]|nr:hypothetical protein [Bacteroidales bacterium]
MSQYKGKPYIVNKSRQTLFERLGDFSILAAHIHELPEEMRSKLGTVTFPDADTMAFTAPGVGEMKFKIVERNAPERIRLLADTGMVPIYVILDLAEEAADKTSVSATIDADIPMMLRPLIGGKLQEAADKFGEMFGQLNI